MGQPLLLAIDRQFIVVCESRPKAKLSSSDFKKAPLAIRGGEVCYEGKPLRAAAGPIVCEAEDGAVVR